MKPSEIKVGSTYRNKGAGNTTRTVLKIEKGLEVRLQSPTQNPSEPVVEFSQQWRHNGRLYLSSFASWCGKEVK